jgi:hypothetical protein
MVLYLTDNTTPDEVGPQPWAWLRVTCFLPTHCAHSRWHSEGAAGPNPVRHLELRMQLRVPSAAVCAWVAEACVAVSRLCDPGPQVYKAKEAGIVAFKLYPAGARKQVADATDVLLHNKPAAHASHHKRGEFGRPGQPPPAATAPCMLPGLTCCSRPPSPSRAGCFSCGQRFAVDVTSLPLPLSLLFPQAPPPTRTAA